MDEHTIEWILTDFETDPVSGIQLSALVFMIYYGFELHNFLLDISDATVLKYPLMLYDVGRSSSYLAGSCGHGFFLNSHIITDLRDFDIVTILNNYEIRKKCHYDDEDITEKLADIIEHQHAPENERDRDYCPSDNMLNTTCDSDTSYLNVEASSFPGYVLLRRCRRHDMSQLPMSERYVSSSAVMKGRFDYWWNAKEFILQSYNRRRTSDSEFESESASESASATLPNRWPSSGPVLSFVDSNGPAINAYLGSRNAPMTTSINADIVIALPFPDWPEQAKDWITRARPSGWPSQLLIKDVLKAGCQIVPTGHYKSPTEDFEWRISFSYGEMFLSRSLSRVQRELIHIFKAVVPQPSYHILNIMYTESELISKEKWVSKNIASLMFHILDIYKECIKSKMLPHYFIPDRNVLEKFQGDFIDHGHRLVPTDEHIDSVLLPLYELRRSPLEMLLKRTKFLSLPETLYNLVFQPFVKASETGLRDKMVYVDTLVLLSKAHFYQGDIERAYLHVQDAMVFYSKLNNRGNWKSIIELHMANAVFSHYHGNLQSALRSLKKLETLIALDDDSFNEYFDHYRVKYFMLYGRITTYMSVIDGTENLQKAARLYSQTVHLEKGNIGILLDRINFLLYIEKVDEAERLINEITSRFFPTVEKDEKNSEEYIEAMNSENDHTETHLSAEGDVQVKKLDLENIEIQNTFPEDSQLQTSDMEILFPENKNHEQSFPVMPTSDIEEAKVCNELYNTESFEDETNLGAQFTTIQATEFEDDFEFEQEDFVEIPDDLRLIDYYFVERIMLAQSYDKIGMKQKSNQILEKVKAEITKSHSNGESIFQTLVKFIVENDYGNAYRSKKLVRKNWSDPFRDYKGYLVYSIEDSLILDNELRSVIKQKGDVVKIPHLVALLHFKIQIYKLKGNTGRVNKIIKILEDTENMRNESKWLLGHHLFQLKKDDQAKAVFSEASTGEKEPSIKEEILSRIDQVMDIIKSYEIRSIALDDVVFSEQ
ncbi:uncharacterized protein LOC117106973 [Anneissia japonica]|uniref:uncharacterized protein LOC117106973 n=1 Tax=Anneissia japonica TaxID=1529436 RepID=UPI001425AFEC|nr:uncharacterized protein LOC117106973 [Anneissia japonica]XP_033104380.1 uncharacterized protein LOC117106973 [Anneissia japonica]XP_033104381.1 uncharacterized protein LOC117106973 [Anneissia japonica]XP_033104383.1 uncharacterized protein LOC117106973 [Anneissia japonica]